MKILTVVGTRPEIIRLSRVIDKLDKYCDHYLIHTGQNYDYELNKIFFDELAIRAPDQFLDCARQSAAETIAEVIKKTDKCFIDYSPDAVLILGDTNSSLSAIAAKRRKIPIFHMEAGNRSFDLRVPEEINRKIVDHLADINMPYSDIARDYLIREGIAPEMIVKTGSPMPEVLSFYRENIDSSDVLQRLKVEEQNYFVVSMHREENVDSIINLTKFIEVLNTICEVYQLPVILSTHPRTSKKLDELGLSFNNLVRVIKPLGLPDYIRLQISAKTVLSDSGSLTEESSILNFPAINIRDVHERPEGMEEGAVIFTGMDVNLILHAIKVIADQGRGEERSIKLVEDYKANNVSEKVLRTILSYVHYINRVVWKKV